MHVVRRDEFYTVFFRVNAQVLVDFRLFGYAVVLHFEIEVVAEHALVPFHEPFGAVEFAPDDCARNFARQTRRKTYKPFAVFCQNLAVDSRFIVEAVAERHGVKIGDVFIARFVFAKEYEMVKSRLAFVAGKVVADVKFRTYNRLDADLVARVEKRDRAVHIAVIGYGKRGHSERFRSFGNGVYSRRSVENAVFGMNV